MRASQKQQKSKLSAGEEVTETRPEDPSAFWVINISKKNVMLGDLGFCIHAGKYYNLLDKKHFHYTYEQLLNSLESGSLYAKKDKVIFLGEEKPNFTNSRIQHTLSQVPIIKPSRSFVQSMDDNLEDLLIDSDEKHAEEMSNLFCGEDAVEDPEEEKDKAGKD